MTGPTRTANFSLGNHPVGINRAVNIPQAIKAPILGRTILVKNPPKA